MRLVPVHFIARLAGAIGWRVRKLLGDDLVDRAIVRIAPHWRALLKKPLYIGVTGSVGKTTTKELLLCMLSRRGRGTGTLKSFNNLDAIAHAIMRLRPTHDFCVAELSEDPPGVMDRQLALLRPGAAIVTVVGNDHWSSYHSRDAIADEMGKLVAALPPTGTAVINADDELVFAMVAKCAAQVITYGISSKADLRAEDISATWPDRLQMTLVRGAERVKLRTQLCGSHWIPSVLGAVGGGLAAGLSLGECADGIASFVPVDGRMQPVTTPDGITFIRDDWKAPLWTLDTCFDFMTAARAKRKIVVIGTLSDCGAGAPEKYIKVAKRAQDIADITVFVGPWASQVLKARKPGAEDALRVFRNVRDAAEYVNTVTRAGDLVLLKGTNKQDHLFRVIMARDDRIACWRDDCERQMFCDECPDRSKASGLPLLLDGMSAPDNPPGVGRSGQRAIDPDAQVIVGLGNPGTRYSGTPHNVGYDVVEKLAATWGLTWDRNPEAWIARGSAAARGVYLVKIQIAMNLTGAALKQLSASMSFGPDQCILVHDDLDMPLGSVRARLSGGAGGHRGVASILEAFQTDAFRRVKIGVGQPAAKLNHVEYVLTAFAQESRATVDQSLATAETRVIEMVASSNLSKQQLLAK